ncbi:hypothetical protein BH23VER1_BH23VER1_35530 [soil metagenome]
MSQLRQLRPSRLFGLLPLVLATALCLAVGEKYPFSDFPMYSRFSDATFYVYLADGAGEPIPVQSLTYVRTSRLKKVYENELRDISKAIGTPKSKLSPAERIPAGEKTLRWLYDTTRPGGKPLLEEHGSLRLYHVDLALDDGHITESAPTLVGQVRVP